MQRSDYKMIWWTLFTLVGMLALFTCCTACLMNKVIFHPTPGVDGNLDALDHGTEHVYIGTSDGVRISAFYL